MPWLAGTAYLHSVMVQEKRDMLKIWNFALIGLTYGLCLFGTMITRAGLVRSVHAFAQTEIFGVLFAWYVGLVLLAFVTALLWRVPQLRSPNRLESVVSREAGFVINNWLFMAILAVVIFGTLYPKFSTLIQGKEVLFGPQWFDLWLAPIGIGLLFLTGVGPLLAWRRATPASLRRQLVLPAATGAAVFALLLAWFGVEEWLAALTWGVAALVSATIAEEFRRATKAKMRGGDSALGALAKLFRTNQQRYGGYVVHLGVVFFFIGFTGQALDTERLENLAPGGSLKVREYELKYLTALPILEQHHGGAEARLALFKGGKPLATLTPEKRMYWLEQQPSSIPAVYSTFAEDFYVILTAIEPNGSATLKVFVNPLVNWVWLGGLTFVVGTMLVIWPHPRRAAA
jgi:cytochrome c-type biogenesis protein CcmF